MLHPQKRNLVIAVTVILMVAVSITSIAALSPGKVEITALGSTSASAPTIVEPLENQLSWDCPGAPSCGGGG